MGLMLRKQKQNIRINYAQGKEDLCINGGINDGFKCGDQLIEIS